MMRSPALALALALALAATSCGSSDEDSDPGPFDVSGYDKSCAAPTDCFLAYSGDPCGCDCAQVAIASSERDRYFADRDAYMHEACPEGAVVCGPCPAAPQVACDQGLCAVSP